MTTAKAILFGAIIIAASILFVHSIQPASAQYATTGLFQLMQHSNTQANSSVFRINSNTGEVSYCFIPGGGTSTEVVCTRPVH